MNEDPEYGPFLETVILENVRVVPEAGVTFKMDADFQETARRAYMCVFLHEPACPCGRADSRAVVASVFGAIIRGQNR